MDSEYILIHQKAERSLNMFENMIDRPDHPIASQIRQLLRQLVDDARSKKRPRSIESRVHEIQRHLDRARRHTEQVMRIEENQDLHRHLGRMREDLRKFHNY